MYTLFHYHTECFHYTTDPLCCAYSSFLPSVATLIFSFSLYFSFSKMSSVQFSSVAQSCPTLCDPMNHSTPGLPVHHQLPEVTQTHVHRVSDAIQLSHPLSSPSPPAPIFLYLIDILYLLRLKSFLKERIHWN